MPEIIEREESIEVRMELRIMNNQEAVSLIVPTRNEEQIVEKNLKLINDHLSGLFEKYEIVVSDYSEDKTPELVKALSKNYPIHYAPVYEKGIGIGIRAGIEAARYDLLMVYPIDMSWDMKCIKTSFQKILSNEGDVILGSRGVKDSVVKRPLKRKVFTNTYNMLVNLFFGLNIRDTQCTSAFRKSRIIPFIDRLDSKTPFLQTQLLIHSKKNNLRIVEIPVVVNDTRTDSKVNPIGDGYSMFRDLTREFFK
jgi:glycosyltransferase involved in cell wall biosynthesis